MLECQHLPTTQEEQGMVTGAMPVSHMILLNTTRSTQRQAQVRTSNSMRRTRRLAV